MASTQERIFTKSKFKQYQNFLKLQNLAKNPLDLTKEGILTPERLKNFCTEACGFKLLYGTEKVTQEIMDALAELAKEANAIEKMAKMQAGEVMNFIKGFPSDDRPVLHTAIRDVFGEENRSAKAKEAARLAKNELDKLKSFMSKVELEKRFDELIMIAIGGSDLGPKAHYLALQYLQPNHKKVHFLSNVDPDDAARIFKKANLEKTLVVVASKSGTTLETVTNEELARQKFKEKNLDPKNHFISVSMQGTPLDNKEKYLECFYIWDYVGGRFSTSSMVGAVPIAFGLGFDVFWEMLRGANAIDKNALNPNIFHNLPLMDALLGIWNRNFLGYQTVALVPYSQGLFRYAAHIQQVDMESNGKTIDQEGNLVDFQTGPIIWGEPGTNAQHSFFQLLHQGTVEVPIEFIGFKESQFGNDLEVEGTTSQEKLLSNLFAQSISLAKGQKDENPNKYFPGNHPSRILLGKKLDPFSVGALLAFFEHRVAFQGFIWNINSFDQEGVQLGKKLANKIIDLFAFKQGKRKEKTDFPLGEAYISHLDNL